MNDKYILLIIVVLVGGFIILFTGADVMAQKNNQTNNTSQTYETAVFAGGCFWCLEKPYDKRDGVVKTVSGYSGGEVSNPSYEQVSSGSTGHREVIQITYDASVIDYETLVEIFWRNIDPFDGGGQFCDRGYQYSSAIYYGSEQEKDIAQRTKAKYEKRFGKTIETEIVREKEFFPAEDYHQNYYTKNPIRYKFYRWNCGRDQRLDEIWGDEARAGSLK